MEDIAPLLGLLLYWRLLLVLAGCLSLALLLATAAPQFTREAILAAFVAGCGAGVAWEAAALRRKYPEAPSHVEGTSSRVVALLGFALMGGLIGLGSYGSIHSLLFALAFMAAVPLTLGPLLSLRSASRPPVGLLACAAAAMWVGFGLAQAARQLGVPI